MDESNQKQPDTSRICRWCGTSLVFNDSFCSELCKTTFYSWLETEHAAIRGKRPQYWNMIRRNALVRSGNRCEACHSEKNLSVHHIVPLSEGGDSTLHNLQVLCQTCHARIHGRKGQKVTRKKKFRIRIRYQPLYVPGILATTWIWDVQGNVRCRGVNQADHFILASSE